MTTTYRIDNPDELVRHARFIADSDFREVEIHVHYDEPPQPSDADTARQAALDEVEFEAPRLRNTSSGGAILTDAGMSTLDDIAEAIADDAADDAADEPEPEPEPKTTSTGVKHKSEVPETVCPICGEGGFKNERSVMAHTSSHTIEERAQAGYEGAQREMRRQQREANRSLEAPSLDSSVHKALSYLVQAEKDGEAPLSSTKLQDRIGHDSEAPGYVKAPSALSRLYHTRMVDREKRNVGKRERKVNVYWPTAMGRAFIEDEGYARGVDPDDDR